MAVAANEIALRAETLASHPGHPGETELEALGAIAVQESVVQKLSG